jgi:hypothetical protein
MRDASQNRSCSSARLNSRDFIGDLSAHVHANNERKLVKVLPRLDALHRLSQDFASIFWLQSEIFRENVIFHTKDSASEMELSSELFRERV